MKKSSYKNYERNERTLLIEETFARGMQYTDIPLEEGFCRSLINFDFKDSGKALMPRGGLRAIELATRVLQQGTLKLAPLLTARAMDANDDSLHRFVLCAAETPGVPLQSSLAFSDALFVVEDTPENFVLAQNAPESLQSVRYAPRYTNVQLHGMPLNKVPPQPLCATLNSIQYLPTVADGLGKLQISKDTLSGQYTAALESVTPREITPNEAVNYGYNMLKEEPYTFADRIVASLVSGLVRCTGLLPYTDATCTELKFNAQTGSDITFRAVCEWPNDTDKFKFKWELRDLDSDAITVYEEPNAGSKDYNYDNTEERVVCSDGTYDVTLTIQPPYRQFAITLTAYSAADLTEPVNIMVLASYSLTADKASSTSGIEVKTYDLMTATGMCTWGQRLVLWGVQGAKNILFVSDINDPSYFPYPNNCDIVEGEIMACLPHGDNLLLWTDTQLLKLTWAEDGLSYTHSTVQNNLLFSDFDLASVCTVGNMVYFKNGNYFYMIVPTTNISNPTGALTLAPISTPAVLNLLDNFESALFDLIQTMYHPMSFDELREDESYELKLDTYYNYPDTSCIRNVYKCRWIARTSDTRAYRELVTFDFILNYDTMLRTWSCYIVESNSALLLPYKQNVADRSSYISICNIPAQIAEDQPDGSVSYSNGYTYQMELLRYNPTLVADDFMLEIGVTALGRRFKNWQFLDTGYREHDSQFRKRYRELQFKINNVDKVTLEFGTEFVLDDAVRKELYKYTTTVSEETGWISIEREFANPQYAPGVTTLTNDTTKPYPPLELSSGELLQTNKWAIGVSKIGSSSLQKVKFPISGKGYAPRLLLLSFNEHRYELLSHNWAARAMNGR